MRFDFCSDAEFNQRMYNYLTELLAFREGMTVDDVRSLVPIDGLLQKIKEEEQL